VLRATTAISAAIAHGVNSIIPVADLDTARKYQEEGYIVAAERNGQVVEGFDLGNSPYSYMNPDLKGKDVVLTTTNGTRAIDMAKHMDQVVIGALVNLDSVIQYLTEQNKSVLLLGSGWKGKFNLEDSICAGAIADALIQTGNFKAEEDSTIAAKYIARSARENIFGFLKASSHRRRLRNLNLNKDMKYCLTPNTLDVIPVLKGNAIVNVSHALVEK